MTLPFILALAGASSVPPAPAPPGAVALDAEVAGRFAALALACVEREYPNKIAHTLASDADAKPPRELTPVFYGCYDWHSSVHGHWLLARLVRLHPQAPFAGPARERLRRAFVPSAIEAEAAYLRADGRRAFERPYGLAWLLQLAAELRGWEDPEARAWSVTLQPLERVARERLAEWVPKLSHPIRSGEHSQTAFAFGLTLDWTRTAGDDEMRDLLAARVRELYGEDRDCPLAYEPSGEDFLSPCLAEADLMRRVLAPAEFAGWLTRFLPSIPKSGATGWLAPAVVADPTDPKLAHLDGLNLSRAWMLDGIAHALPAADPRVRALGAAVAAHRERGLASVTGEHYEGGHWLGSFATYLMTQRGLAPDPPSSVPPS
jgi:hypothetical protein